MRAVRIVLGTDMRMMHAGLERLMTELKAPALNTGEAIIFINSARNKLKSFSYNGVVSYVRFTKESKRTIDLDALDEIARSFRSDGTLDYNAGLKRHLEKRLNIKGKTSAPEMLVGGPEKGKVVSMKKKKPATKKPAKKPKSQRSLKSR